MVTLTRKTNGSLTDQLTEYKVLQQRHEQLARTVARFPRLQEVLALYEETLETAGNLAQRAAGARSISPLWTWLVRHQEMDFRSAIFPQRIDNIWRARAPGDPGAQAKDREDLRDAGLTLSQVYVGSVYQWAVIETGYHGDNPEGELQRVSQNIVEIESNLRREAARLDREIAPLAEARGMLSAVGV